MGRFGEEVKERLALPSSGLKCFTILSFNSKTPDLAQLPKNETVSVSRKNIPRLDKPNSSAPASIAPQFSVNPAQIRENTGAERRMNEYFQVAPFKFTLSAVVSEV